MHANVDLRMLLFCVRYEYGGGRHEWPRTGMSGWAAVACSSLRERGGVSLSSVRLRRVIVTAQIALTLILVVSAALFVRTLERSWAAKGPGFRTASLVSF